MNLIILYTIPFSMSKLKRMFMKVVVPCEAAGLLWLSGEAQWWQVLEIGVSYLLSPPPMLGERGSHHFQNRGYFCKFKETSCNLFCLHRPILDIIMCAIVCHYMELEC